LTGTQSSGKYLRSDGTDASLTAIQVADVPILNQNTTGTAANVTGVVAIANGGTGETSQQAAINVLTGTQSSGKYLRSDGTNASLTAIQVADVPILNQNTTGTAANVTGVVAIANGGTGLTSSGTKGQVLTSKGDGTLEWTGTYIIDVENDDLGGFVFYLTPDTKHGLVVATVDQCSSCKWIEAEDEINRPTSHNAVGGNFTNWRLPTKYELGLLYAKRNNIPGLNTGGSFWSSTDAVNSTRAFYMDFSLGSASDQDKSSTNYRVRAVRSF
jgi:hypothetical protein